jgi:hypothetical protein
LNNGNSVNYDEIHVDYLQNGVEIFFVLRKNRLFAIDFFREKVHFCETLTKEWFNPFLQITNPTEIWRKHRKTNIKKTNEKKLWKSHPNTRPGIKDHLFLMETKIETMDIIIKITTTLFTIPTFF